mmetsp:Transcript_22584/g.22861  ORF Transcript_22584/g.22861 Transcript_22584/m.22861 type:complete len:122 (+) Transcript_22584:1283-1648(+)
MLFPDKWLKGGCFFIFCHRMGGTYIDYYTNKRRHIHKIQSNNSMTRLPPPIIERSFSIGTDLSYTDIHNPQSTIHDPRRQTKRYNSSCIPSVRTAAILTLRKKRTLLCAGVSIAAARLVLY